jgi:hypothetical protein
MVVPKFGTWFGFIAHQILYICEVVCIAVVACVFTLSMLMSLFKRRHAFRSESIERFIKQIVISEMSNA